MAIGKAIYNILSNDSAVSNSVGDRIFPNRIQIDNRMPCIVYQVVTTQPSNTKNSKSNLDVISVDITAFGETYDKTNRLASDIRRAMDYQFTDTTQSGIKIQHISFQGLSDEYDESFGDHGIHYIVMEFEIRQQL